MNNIPNTDEIAGKLRKHIQNTAKANMPPAVQLSVYDGSRQMLDGYVWATLGDKQVQCIAPGPIDLSLATLTNQIVIWAYPSNPDEPSAAYIMIGSAIDGVTNNRAPALITTGVTVIGSGGGTGGGTVTSVGLSAAPAGIFDVTNTPVTSSGTLALSMDNQSANTVLSGPTSGGAATPGFRSLVSGDIPDISGTYIAKAFVNAKGDLIGASANDTPAIVGVGTDGDSLIADSSASAGVAYLNTGKLRVTNSSGATANVGDVGYIDNTGVYKTTTTAALVASWCAVVAGGANTSTITVIKRGRITLNYTGTAPTAGQYLTTSTSAGLVRAYTLAHRGIMAVALANGAGGTVDSLLLCNSEDVDAFDSNDIFSINLVSTIAFTSTVSGTPNATSFVYGAVVTGAENVLVPTSATLLGKALMWNTTRTQARMMTAVDTGTNTVTNVSVTDAWANTDALTIESQTCTTGQTWKAMDIDISQSTSVLPANIRTIYADLIVRDTTAGATSFASIHPYETFALSKLQTQYMGVNSVFNSLFVRIPIIDNRFCVTGAFGGAGTGSIYIRLNGYKIAAP